jgi:hypothetical protein
LIKLTCRSVLLVKKCNQSLVITRLNLPGASGKLIKFMARKGNIKKYTGKQITHEFRLHLMDAVGASMSISGSLFNGTIGTMAIGIYEELAG